ncbi:GTP pyrophosphokinase [Virgibacillus oceani]|uniref:GTP pyrophosphokinase YwaC n=1 Tax=Virgibacillus oceani TaxID=1479511 RepID=A0A917HUE9_9BACI|nr:GTP pyrophosphokinase family protein [Virgibacillus oceani]GGG88879.1 GTP pyrophosphokinase YwaC [Virgibacillus oceani]
MEIKKSVLYEWKNLFKIYKFALDEVNTKLNILNEDFQFIHQHNPIEHLNSRIKTPESTMEKLARKGLEPTLENAKKYIHDIAGIRITCSFITDIYSIYELIRKQDDINILQIKDYIKQPKPNGYKSLHLIIDVPIFLTDRVEKVKVEIQIRTIAMDFWASLEHKIYYKFDKAIPASLRNELKEAADSANYLDERMEKIKTEVDLYARPQLVKG